MNVCGATVTFGGLCCLSSSERAANESAPLVGADSSSLRDRFGECIDDAASSSELSKIEIRRIVIHPIHIPSSGESAAS